MDPISGLEQLEKSCVFGRGAAFLSPVLGHEAWGSKLATQIGTLLKMKRKCRGQIHVAIFLASQVQSWSPISGHNIGSFWSIDFSHIVGLDMCLVLGSEVNGLTTHSTTSLGHISEILLSSGA